jgi:hypothetical protein
MRSRRQVAGLVIALCSVASACVPAPAAWHAAEATEPALAAITPHRGIYVLDLVTAGAASGVAGARGVAYFEWAKSCEGYLVNQHVRMQLTMNEGQSGISVLLFSSFESADGRQMRFKLQQVADGAVTERLEGVAELKGDGSGTAHFSTPERTEVALPVGTLFPTAYTRQALAAMVAGELQFSAYLFDGSTADGAYRVSTFYGAPTPRPKPGGKPNESEPFWANRAGYFQIDAGEAEPLFEVGSLVNASGVAEWFDLDYGSFAVRARLEEFEALPEPKC